MRARPAAVACLLTLGAASPALGDPLDPALGRLVLDPACRDDAGRFVDTDLAALEAGPGGQPHCVPDQAAFKRLVSQYGFALAPSALPSARAPGFGGFELALEAVFTSLSSGERYWQDGTQGPVDGSTGAPAPRHAAPPSLLQLYSLRFRRGFGFGLELSGVFGLIPRSSLLSAGVDARLALLEGFRRDAVLRYVPDVALGGGVRAITGSPELSLRVTSLELVLSKPFPLLGSGVVTPWLGLQQLWISAGSGTVDLTPGTDAQNTPPGAAPDVENDAEFGDVTLERRRVLVGVGYRFELLKAGVQIMTDLVSPSSAQSSDADADDLAGEARQWAVALELGAAF